jgi:signal transduction histidine kinase
MVHKYIMRLLRNIICIICLSIIGLNGWTQNRAIIDSLLIQLNNSKSDSVKADICNELCWNYRVEYPKLGYEYGLKALNYYIQEKKIVKQCNILNKLGINKRNTGEYSASLDQFFRILNIAEKPSCNLELAYANNNIADIYSRLEKYDKANEFADHALALFQSENNKNGIAYNYNLRGVIYQNQKVYRSASKFFRQSLEIRLQQNDKAGAASSFINIGDCYLELNMPDSALDNYKKGIAYYDKAGFANYGRSYISLGRYYAAKKDYREAIKYLEEAISQATLVKSPENKFRANEVLHRVYYKLNEFKKAYDIQAYARTIEDTLRKADYIRKITTLELNYNFEQQVKQKEIEEIKKNVSYESHLLKQKLLSVSLIALLLGISIVTFFVYKKSKYTSKTNKLLESYNQEISSQKLAILDQNDQLKELNATKDKFFNIIAHDLKNPFNGILGLSDVIISSPPDTVTYEELIDMVKMIHGTSESAFNLLENLLEWSKTQIGRIEFCPEKFLLDKLFRDIYQLLNNQSKQKNISINFLTKEMEIVADRNMIHTILRNLITNAIKFTNDGGKIEIEAIQTSTDLQITVRDSGVGISESDKEKLFRISEKTATFGTRNEKGTGLGLLLCKELVEKHGGRIWVESEPGKGSSFIFSIPV